MPLNVSFIPFFVFAFWWRSYKILCNLCLHFARQDEQDGKKRKENHSTKMTKMPRTKGRNMGWTKHKIIFEANFEFFNCLNSFFYLLPCFLNIVYGEEFESDNVCQIHHLIFMSLSFSDFELLWLLFHNNLYRGSMPQADILRFNSASRSLLPIWFQSSGHTGCRSLPHLFRL